MAFPYRSITPEFLAASSSSEPSRPSYPRAEGWSPESWKTKPIKQQPPYPEESLPALESTLDMVKSLPPLVGLGEIESLKQGIAAAGLGKSFIIQGGDCAERFVDCQKTVIENKLRILLQMSLVIVWLGRRPVTRIWRGAGQFAKPRSSDTEVTASGQTVPSFRGDNVNGFAEDERTPDPRRLLQAYFHSAATLNYIRALIDSGFCSLFYPHKWDLATIPSEVLRTKYNKMIEELEHGLDLMRTIGAAEQLSSSLSRISIGTSHEGLILAYESALTQEVEADGPTYNFGSHFLWIGDRTRQLDGAHIEYFRGVANPIGVKCGPSLKPDELAELVRTLNPSNEPGKLTLITRYGAEKIADHLPAHIEAVKATGIFVTWISDAVHGNTFLTPDGTKTRSLENIWLEIQRAFEIHRDHGSVLGGIHLELTGENVTECVGGPEDLTADHLHQAYTTYCDPRLNYTQSLEIAFRVAALLRTDLPVARRS